MVPTRYRTHLAGHDSSGAFIVRVYLPSIAVILLPFETKLTRLTTTDEQYDALKKTYEEFPFTWSSNQSTGSERSFASLASDESFHYRECEPPM